MVPYVLDTMQGQCFDGMKYTVSPFDWLLSFFFVHIIPGARAHGLRRPRRTLLHRLGPGWLWWDLLLLLRVLLLVLRMFKR